MNNHRAHKISRGHYSYRGYEIICVGYYNPEHRVCWECVDSYGHGFGQSYTLKECKSWIDAEIVSEENPYI